VERTVPKTASDEIELYLRTYYSLLRSTEEVHIRALEEAHAGMNSLLHPNARKPLPDLSAFIYSWLRLPACMLQVRLIVMGQGGDVFMRDGYGDVKAWQIVEAPARRRRYFYDGNDTIASFIVSRSDIDDIVPLLTAFQIEWNKLHILLRHFTGGQPLEKFFDDPNLDIALINALNISAEAFASLKDLWGARYLDLLAKIAANRKHLSIRLLSGSFHQYRRAAYVWWEFIETAKPDLLTRPVYFVSSNTHSLINLITGFALKQQARLLEFVELGGDSVLKNELEAIRSEKNSVSFENFLYFLQKVFFTTPPGQALRATRKTLEEKLGVQRIGGQADFDLEAQVIDLAKLDIEAMDPRLRIDGVEALANSDAIILNIDYPLGLAAYNILSQIAERVTDLRGIYIMGKAATLNGVVGDVMIPNVVHDEQFSNTHIFPNCFQASDIKSYMTRGTVLDNQKAVTVQGTFLQTSHYMDVFYREGYTDIEMEAGPYLSAIYEMYRPTRHPTDEIVNHYSIQFDFGLVHYASDKPLSKGQNLGAGNLSFVGMDATYGTAIAILRRIFTLERERLHNSARKERQ
jgi:hypothetical protein